MTIGFLIIAAAAVFFWFSAEAVYESHRKTRENHPLIFRITGMNEKYLDDRAGWIRHFRIQMLLATILCSLAMLAIFLRARGG